MCKRIAIALLAAAPALPAMGQGTVTAGTPFAARGLAAQPAGMTITFGSSPQPRQFFPTGFLLGNPLLFSDWTSGPVPLAPQSSPVIVVQTPPAVPEAKTETKPAVTPLLIEWRGDRYVRFSGPEESVGIHARQVQPDYAEQFRTPAKPATADKAPAPPRELLPVVLVARDGRREEVSAYIIAGGILYAASDYFSSGFWTKKILLADLDLPATFRLNQARGVRFVLPAGPDQVVTRP